jgi:transposase-like protein
MSQCPACQAAPENQVKAGKNRSGSQRCLCKVCGENYTPAPRPNGYPEELRKQVILLCLDGQTFRSIGRKLGVNHQTVANWVNAYVTQSARAIYKKPKN